MTIWEQFAFRLALQAAMGALQDTIKNPQSIANEKDILLPIRDMINLISAANHWEPPSPPPPILQDKGAQGA